MTPSSLPTLLRSPSCTEQPRSEPAGTTAHGGSSRLLIVGCFIGGLHIALCLALLTRTATTDVRVPVAQPVEAR